MPEYSHLDDVSEQHSFFEDLDPNRLLSEATAWFAADGPLRVAVRGTCMGKALQSPGHVEVSA